MFYLYILSKDSKIRPELRKTNVLRGTNAQFKKIQLKNSYLKINFEKCNEKNAKHA